MKLILSKTTMIVTAGVATAAVGGGAYAATTSHTSTLRSDSHKVAALPKAAPAVKAPKNVVEKGKEIAKSVALPKASAAPKPALPPVPAAPVLPGFSCPAAPSVSNLSSVLTAPWGLSLTADKAGAITIQGHAYCEVTQTWTDPAGNVLSLRTVPVPAGLAIPKLGKALGFVHCVPASLTGTQAWQSPVGSGVGIIWIQRSNVVLALSGDSVLPMQALAGAVRNAG